MLKKSVKPVLEMLEEKVLPSVSSLSDPATVVRNGYQWHIDVANDGNYAEEVRDFGLPGDRFLTGDWNGDGYKDLIAVRNTPQGFLQWFIDINGDNRTDIHYHFGLNGDTPILGDWDGNGNDDPGVVRANAFRGGLDWYLDPTHINYANPPARHYGLTLTGDMPVVGDWNRDGIDDIGVVRRNHATNALDWLFEFNGDHLPDMVRQYGLVSTKDLPITGDWNEDGNVDLGIVRGNPADGSLAWFLDTNGDVHADQIRKFGQMSDIVVSGKTPSHAPLSGSPVNPAYQPMRGSGINLEIYKDIYYNPNSSREATVAIKVTNPQRALGQYKVRLYWADQPSLKGRIQVAAEKIVNVPRVSPGGIDGVRFSNSDIASRPTFGRYLIAVVDPDNDIFETNELDNAKAVHVDSRTNHRVSLNGQPQSQTFVFLIPGFSSSTGITGMHKLEQKIKSDPAFANAHVSTLRGGLIGQNIYQDAKTWIKSTLQSGLAGPNDKVFLIGHSLGGDAVRRLASDLRYDVPGLQPATAVVAIEPIDAYRAQFHGQLDQSGLIHALPTGIRSSDFYTIVQRTSGASNVLKGYTVAGGLTNYTLAYGRDGIRNTSDDLIHTQMDDDPIVQDHIIRYLRGKV